MKLPRLQIRPSAWILAGIWILLDRSVYALIPLAAALCHEGGHLLAMLLFHQRVDSVMITPFGMEIRSGSLEDAALPAKLLIWSGGALANLLCSVAAILLPAYPDSPALGLFASSGFILGTLNLLPIPTLDGGCILREILLACRTPQPERLLSQIGGAAAFLLWLLSIWICLRAGGNLSLLAFCACLFTELWIIPRTNTLV